VDTGRTDMWRDLLALIGNPLFVNSRIVGYTELEDSPARSLLLDLVAEVVV